MMEGVFKQLDKTITGTAAQHGGYVCKGNTGKFLIVFQHISDAIQFSFVTEQSLMQQTWPAELLATEENGPHPDAPAEPVIVGPRLSIGMATGEPTMFAFNKVTSVMDYFGTFLNLGARVCGVAAPGQVLGHVSTMEVAEKWRQQLALQGQPLDLDMESTGLHKLKGIKDENELFDFADKTLQKRRAVYEELRLKTSGTTSPGILSPISPMTST